MRTLETDFSSGGFEYGQLARVGALAIYQQSKGGRITSYELIRIQVRPAETIRGREYPERECYPSAESWGTDAWTISNQQEAAQRLQKLAGKTVRKVHGNELQPA